MIEAVAFDVFGTLLQIGERRHPYRQLLQHARRQGRRPGINDARTLMTRDLGLAGAAEVFGVQLSLSELAKIERDLNAELASIRVFDDALDAITRLKAEGLKIALCSNLASPYAIAARLLLPNVDAEAFSFKVGAIKPEADIYWQLIESLGCEATAIAMLGDQLEADAIGPARVGIWGYHLQRSGLVGSDSFSSLGDFVECILQSRESH